MQYFKFVNWWFRFLMSRTGCLTFLVESELGSYEYCVYERAIYLTSTLDCNVCYKKMSRPKKFCFHKFVESWHYFVKSTLTGKIDGVVLAFSTKMWNGNFIVYNNFCKSDVSLVKSWTSSIMWNISVHHGMFSNEIQNCIW